jgi:FtsP/CotA-like multicopper oxidase with cupredoxin domain
MKTFCAILLSACLFKPIRSVGVTNVVGAAFAGPEECTTLDCTLHFSVANYHGPNAQFLTRGYNGEIPGPTIRASAGDTLLVNLINTLEDVANAGDMNSYRLDSLFTANLQVMLLHIALNLLELQIRRISTLMDCIFHLHPLATTHSLKWTRKPLSSTLTRFLPTTWWAFFSPTVFHCPSKRIGCIF